MRDFTHKMYHQLCRAIHDAGYQTIALGDYFATDDHSQPRMMLRHDVDRDPQLALEMAQIEHEHKLQSTYLFRVIDTVFKPDIINKIAELGMEIAYHYECLDKAKGDYEKAFEIIVVDSLAYVIRQYGHPTHDYYVAIFNIQDPAIPTLVNTIEHPNWVSDIKVVNNIAYVSYYRNGIGIYDVSNADSINLLGYYFRRHNGRSIDVRFPYIYKASTYVGIEIIDVSDPANPFSAHKIDIIS